LELVGTHFKSVLALALGVHSSAANTVLLTRN
jgi:hypothetical protein